MKPKALVVEDDPAIVSTVGEILASLGHSYDAADSMEAARGCMEATEYSYFLIDLEIPVHSGRGLARIENGENLIDETIRKDSGLRHRIIVITAHGNDGPHQAVEIMKKGIADYVPKPFPTSGDRTLDKAIRRMLAGHDAELREMGEQKRDDSPDKLTKFAGGEMVFFQDRVELCGVDVTAGRTSRQDCKALNELRRRLPNGAFWPCTSRRLAAVLGESKKPESIPGFIRCLCKRIAKRLRSAGIECGDDGAIIHTNEGYQFRDWLTVQSEGGSTTTQPCGTVPLDGTVGGTVNVSRDGTVPGTPGTVAARRQQLRTIVATERLRVPGLAERLRCSRRTVMRYLKALENEIEFEGLPSSGYYRLRQVKNAR